MGERDSLSVSFWFNCAMGNNLSSSLFDYGRNAVRANIDGYSGPTTFKVTAFYNNLDELNAAYNFSFQQWYHIYVSAGVENSIYINGENVGQIFKDIALELADSSLVIGKSVQTDGNDEIYFKGSIDDIKIFNYLLSDQQIRGLYNTSNNSQ